MKAIVAIDNEWNIGNANELLFKIKDDLKRFKILTLGKFIVMGRKTLESFPNSKPLQGRVNIVLTSDKSYKVDNAIVLHSIPELMEYIKYFDTDDIFVIGGSSVYEQLLDSCDIVWVTRVTNKVYEADTKFPNLDNNPDWECMSDVEYPTPLHDKETNLDYQYYIYGNIKRR